MKKIVLLLIFLTLGVFAEEPSWLREYKSGNFEQERGVHLYFIGISQSYKPSQRNLAKRGAIRSGLTQISNYINVSIDISLKIKSWKS